LLSVHFLSRGSRLATAGPVAVTGPRVSGVACRCRARKRRLTGSSRGLLAFPRLKSNRLMPHDGFFRPSGCHAASVFVSSGFAPGSPVPAVQGRSPSHSRPARRCSANCARAPDSIVAGASHEVLFPSAFAGCAVPWKPPTSHDSAAAFVGSRHPRLDPFALAVFWPARPA
jgi:hypothetical protein